MEHACIELITPGRNIPHAGSMEVCFYFQFTIIERKIKMGCKQGLIGSGYLFLFRVLVVL